LPKKSYEIRSVLEFDLVNIEAKVTHVPVAVWIVICSTYVRDLMVVGPTKPVIIAVSDPEFEVIASIRRNDPAGIFGLVAELQG
jgi:hypothetical protein